MCRAAYESFDRTGDQQVSLTDLAEGRLIGQLTSKDLKRVLRDLGEELDTVDFASFMKMLRVDKIRKALLAKSKSMKSGGNMSDAAPSEDRSDTGE